MKNFLRSASGVCTLVRFPASTKHGFSSTNTASAVQTRMKRKHRSKEENSASIQYRSFQPELDNTSILAQQPRRMHRLPLESAFILKQPIYCYNIPNDTRINLKSSGRLHNRWLHLIRSSRTPWTLIFFSLFMTVSSRTVSPLTLLCRYIVHLYFQHLLHLHHGESVIRPCQIVFLRPSNPVIIIPVCRGLRECLHACVCVVVIAISYSSWHSSLTAYTISARSLSVFSLYPYITYLPHATLSSPSLCDILSRYCLKQLLYYLSLIARLFHMPKALVEKLVNHISKLKFCTAFFLHHSYNDFHRRRIENQPNALRDVLFTEPRKSFIFIDSILHWLCHSITANTKVGGCF